MSFVPAGDAAAEAARLYEQESSCATSRDAVAARLVRLVDEREDIDRLVSALA